MTTYHEMYSDFLDAIILYTENVTVTPLSFMRWATEGLSRMQRETRLVEAVTTLLRDPLTDSTWTLPPNVLDYLVVQDSAGIALVPKTHEEFVALREQSEHGLPQAFSDPARFRQYPARGVRGLPTARIWCVRDREITIYPDNADTTLTLHYVPHIEALSSTSPQWATWFATGLVEERIHSEGPPEVYQPYTHALVAYAVMRYLRSRRVRDYLVYEAEFKEAIEQAKINKPVLNRILQPLYRM